MGIYLATIFLFRNSKNVLLCYSSLLAILCIYFFGVTNRITLGDYDLLIAHASDPNISIAEPISYFLYKWIIKYIGNVNYLNLISPIFGIFTLGSYFLLSQLLSKNLQIKPWLFQIGLIAMPLPFFYTYGYIENTQLSTPFLILFLYFSLRFLIVKNYKFEWLYWCYLSTSMCLAILVHGQNWFVMPIIFLLPILSESFFSAKDYVKKYFYLPLFFVRSR